MGFFKKKATNSKFMSYLSARDVEKTEMNQTVDTKPNIRTDFLIFRACVDGKFFTT